MRRRGDARIDDLECDAFLAGPDRYARWQEGEVERLYGVNDAHERMVCDILDEHPADRASEIGSIPTDSDPNFRISHHEAGVILRCPRRRIAGVYLGLHLAIHPQYRGRGFGHDMIVARYLRDGHLAVWDLDPPAYTRAGLCAHRAAWKTLQDLPGITRAYDLIETVVPQMVPSPPNRRPHACATGASRA